MILHLIGPKDHFTVNYWMEDEAPSVVYTLQRVWVKSSYTYGSNEHRYYEQQSARFLPDTFLTKIDPPPALQATESDR